MKFGVAIPQAMAIIMGIPTEAIIYGAIVVFVTGILAFLYRKYSEVVRMFLEEKLTYLEWTIKLLETILPTLPDEYKKHVLDYLAFLKWWKQVNEVLLGVSPTTVYKLWVEKKSKADLEIKAMKAKIGG